MATTVTIEAHRKRFIVKATPMMPLSALVADVLSQLKPGDTQPADCRLLLKGKVLDQTTPVRFANIGGNKLELQTGREPTLGVQAPAPPAAAAARPPAPGQQQEAAAAATSTQAATGLAELQAGTSTAPAAAAPAVTAAAAAPSDTAAIEDSHPSVAVFGQRVYVFTRHAEQQVESASTCEVADVDESFFEFTEMDLRRAVAGAAAQRAKQEGGHLMTSAMREREERRRAESYGSVPIRLYLPDGVHCLHTELPSTAPLSAVLALARAALLPGAAPGAYLFTTPPRTVLKEKDLAVSLHAAKMVPAAKLHVGYDASKAPAGSGAPPAAETTGGEPGAARSGTTTTTTSGGSSSQWLLKPDVLALVEQPPQRAEVMHAKQQQQRQAPAEAGPNGSAAAAAAGGAGASRLGGTGAAQVQKGVPKWMKLGK